MSARFYDVRNNRVKRENLMRNVLYFVLLVCLFSGFSNSVDADTIRGKVVDEFGSPVEGVMVSAIDDVHRKWISVFLSLIHI